MKKFANILFGIIWGLAGVFCLLGCIAGKNMKDGDIIVTGVSLLTAWITVSVSVFIIREKAVRKKEWDWITQKTYKEEYVNSAERSFWDKIPLGAKIAFSVIWLIVGVAFILTIIRCYSAAVRKPVNIGLILSVGWFAVSIATLAVIGKTERKQEERLKEMYEQKYVSSVEFDDPIFGKMKFRFNTDTNELTASGVDLPPFGADKPSDLTVTDYAKADREKIFKALRGVYAHKEEILDTVCGDYWETLEEWGEFEEDDSPALTKEELREKMAVSDIEISNGGLGLEVCLDIYVKDRDFNLGGHVYEVVVDIETGKISCGIG